MGSACAQQQTPRAQDIPAVDQRERQLFDAAANLEGELQRLNEDLDALIDHAEAGVSKDAKPLPAPQDRMAPAPSPAR